MSRIPKMSLTRREAILAAAGSASLLLPGFALPKVVTRPGFGFGRSQPFDSGWRFLRGDTPGAEVPGFDDSDWRTVDLPHDWSIEDIPAELRPAAGTVIGPFDSNAEGGLATGFTLGGEGWYRKPFRLSVVAGARVELAFEGAYMDSDVWLNGHHLGTHHYGYTPFAYDLTPYAATDGNNVIAVRVRNWGRNSRWYSGSGIYRHVWLDVLPHQARLARWGIFASTRSLSDTSAQIEIAAHLEDLRPGLMVRSRIVDSDGRTVWKGTTPATSRLRQTATIASPKVWSPDSPHLYRLDVELRRGATVIDRQSTPFGVRIVTFDAVRGMTLNGLPLKLRGGCVHHDNGLLGAASFDAAEDRKVRLLKARGFNAVRPAHNPFPPAFYDACDRHGLLVVFETFDAWQWDKLPDDYSAFFGTDWRSDLRTMIVSARNHPSIIMWSIGNEIPGRNLPAGIKAQWELANEVHTLDRTRPVTAAINDFVGQPVLPGPGTARSGHAGEPDQASVVFLDIAGYNYGFTEYEQDHETHGSRILVGTESMPKDVFAIWDLIEGLPYVLGDFVWTALDYLGEAGIGGSVYQPAGEGGKGVVGFPPREWPDVVSRCGDIDLIGNQKAQSLARDVVWELSPLELAVRKPPPEGQEELVGSWGWSDERQSWTWPGVEGKSIVVRAYTQGDRVEMWLNGRMLACKELAESDLKHTEFEIAYRPGTLEAMAYRRGARIVKRSLTTAGRPAAIRMIPEIRGSGAGRGDLTYVGIELTDSAGHWVPDTVRELELSISGPAELAGFGSADPFAVGSFQSNTTRTWNGRALAVLRGRGRTGAVRVAVNSHGLESAAATLHLTREA